MLPLEVVKHVRSNNVTRTLKECLNGFQLFLSVSSKQLHLIYYTQIESSLRYGGISTIAEEVFICQKGMLRCRQVFNMQKILALPSIDIYELFISTFKNKLSFILIRSVHEYHTRKGNDFSIPFCCLNISESSLSVMDLKYLIYFRPV